VLEILIVTVAAIVFLGRLVFTLYRPSKPGER
jgi:hypothetical protein